MAGDEEKALDTYLVTLEGDLRGNDFWIVPALQKSGNYLTAGFAIKAQAGFDIDCPDVEDILGFSLGLYSNSLYLPSLTVSLSRPQLHFRPNPACRAKDAMLRPVWEQPV